MLLMFAYRYLRASPHARCPLAASARSGRQPAGAGWGRALSLRRCGAWRPRPGLPPHPALPIRCLHYTSRPLSCQHSVALTVGFSPRADTLPSRSALFPPRSPQPTGRMGSLLQPKVDARTRQHVRIRSHVHGARIPRGAGARGRRESGLTATGTDGGPATAARPALQHVRFPLSKAADPPRISEVAPAQAPTGPYLHSPQPRTRPCRRGRNRASAHAAETASPVSTAPRVPPSKRFSTVSIGGGAAVGMWETAPLT